MRMKEQQQSDHDPQKVKQQQQSYCDDQNQRTPTKLP